MNRVGQEYDAAATGENGSYRDQFPGAWCLKGRRWAVEREQHDAGDNHDQTEPLVTLQRPDPVSVVLVAEGFKAEPPGTVDRPVRSRLSLCFAGGSPFVRAGTP